MLLGTGHLSFLTLIFALIGHGSGICDSVQSAIFFGLLCAFPSTILVEEALERQGASFQVYGRISRGSFSRVIWLQCSPLPFIFAFMRPRVPNKYEGWKCYWRCIALFHSRFRSKAYNKSLCEKCSKVQKPECEAECEARGWSESVRRSVKSVKILSRLPFSCRERRALTILRAGVSASASESISPPPGFRHLHGHPRRSQRIPHKETLHRCWM